MGRFLLKPRMEETVCFARIQLRSYRLERDQSDPDPNVVLTDIITVLISPEVLQQHWDYSVWATTRLLDAAGQLSPEEVARDFNTADGSVLETLVHLFWSETIWLNRFNQVIPPSRPAKGTHDLP